MLAELLDAGGLKAEDHVKYIVTEPCGSALLCSAQVCVPPPAIRVWPFFEGGVCREGVQVFAIISVLRGTKCG